MTRIPLRGPWPIAPGDVVLLIVLGHGQHEHYARVTAVRQRTGRRIHGLTTADGRRWTVREGGRLCWVYGLGAQRREHIGAVGVVVEMERRAGR